MQGATAMERDTGGFAPAWAWALLTLFVGVLLAYAGRGLILAANMEIGDLAANSILVQDAKRLSLWVGNYSRIGFNHPGPAILYVLAAGELVFHDWLHLVPSPLSGQLVAAALYTAFWITLLARLLRRSFPPREAAVATAVFVLMAAFYDPQFLGGLWFPHLYFFPFAVALLAFARLAAGRGDSLVSLALACGFLVNGHVSFIITTGLMFACVAAYNFAVYWLEPERCLIRRDFRVRHGRQLLLAIGVFALFLLPLAVMTVREYPGPLAQYAHFGGRRQPNAMPAALRFVSVYWGGMAAFLLAMLVCGLLSVRKAAAALGFPPLRDVLAAIFAATFATLFYARYGVDHLDQVYIGLYYHAAPCLLAAVLAAVLLRMVPEPWSPAAAVAVLALAVPATFFYAEMAQGDARSFRQESPRQLLAALEARRGPLRTVLLLEDARSDWGDVWSALAGAKALARRTGTDPFCIGRRWHILFSKQAHCTPEELRVGEQFYVTKAAAQPLPGETFQAGGFSFQRQPASVVRLGTVTIQAQPEMFQSFILGPGWSGVEAELVRSEAREAALSLALPKKRPATVLLDLQADLPRAGGQQSLDVVAGGQLVGHATFTSTASRQAVKLALPDGALAADIRLRLARPTGVALYGIRVETH